MKYLIYKKERDSIIFKFRKSLIAISRENKQCQQTGEYILLKYDMHKLLKAIINEIKTSGYELIVYGGKSSR